MNDNINNRNLSIFNFRDIKIRVIADDPQQPYFTVKDVCEVLEIKDSRTAVKQIQERLNEAGLDGVVSNRTILKDRLGRNQTLITTNEQGLYELIFSSRKKQAVKFRAWVTGQVLPQLRKTGSYTLPTPVIRRINAQSRPRVRDYS
ncbi:BRO-N domain-containing protein [Abyssogena phaseoliformis symbiont]|uniref:BRO-N domain-containing protein n=1 Tax=Abyssogena phaseoliformis symbiont TaxID=596095 RepID=UPI001914F34C|nr:BRO family protein [Abyssogena phaseoliformis symbiont]